MKKIIAIALTASALAALLTACGGGGSSTPAGTETAGTVASNSEETAAFTLLNAERASCGFGTLTQNAAISMAARNHSDWVINNSISHVETAGTLGFTGVNLTDRMAFAGYAPFGSFGAGENISGFLGINNKTGVGAESVRGLLNAPYHLRVLVAGFRDVGISVRNPADSGSSSGAQVITTINLGHTGAAGLQRITAGTVVTYPCQGSTGVKHELRNETPNPVLGRDLAVNPLGTSIYVSAREGTPLVITGAQLVIDATNAPITLLAPVTRSNDPQTPKYFLDHEAYIAADRPLATNTTYRMTINGTQGGTLFTRMFTFTTGS